MLKSLQQLGRRIHNRLQRPFFAAHWRNVSYDEQMVEVMARVLRRDSACIDVGAHAGDVLREMVRLAPRGRHHAFEALPHLAQRLRLKFPDVTVHELAISDCSGQAEFLHVENAPAYSGLRQRSYDSPDPKITQIRVSVATLDEIIPNNQQVAFVKIDVEGGEYHVIKGAAKTLARCRPIIAFEAGARSTGHYGVTPQMMVSLLDEIGYSVSTMRRWLTGLAPAGPEWFCRNWHEGPEFFFIAVPRSQPGQRRDR